MGKMTGIVVGIMLASGAPWAQKVAMTPPMGWNSWNTFYGNINESVIKGIIDVMATNGMRAAGYVYVNLDDNWMANPARDGSGNLRADPTRFPSGIKSLSDYAHAKGMKLGIYSDRGSMTCMNVPQSGGYGHEAADARTYASWGIDYLKYDNCNTVGQMQSDYTTMAAAITKTGRPMVFSICAWQTQAWMPDVGNLWRSTDDITTEWLGTSNVYGRAIMTNLDGNAGNFIFTRPGAWADPDMLEVGNGSLTFEENKAHFGLWALMAAPLIAGNDVRKVSATNLALLTNADVIAVDQDSAGIQGRKIADNGDQEIWVKPLGRDFTTFAVGLFNRSATTANMTINWKDLRLDTTSVAVRDLWAKKDLGVARGHYSVQVPSHGLALFKVVGLMDPAATYWVSDLPFTALANGFNFLQVDKSNGGKALKLGSKSYAKGLGTNAAARIAVPLHRKFNRFQSDIGIDAETTGGSAVFQVIGDGKTLYTSPVCKGGAAAVSIDVSVQGVDSLVLVATDAGDGNTNDHADWAGAKLVPASTVGVLRSVSATKWRAGIEGDILVMERPTEDPAEVRIVNGNGLVVQSGRIRGTRSELQLDGFPRGIYFVHLVGSLTNSSATVYRN